MSVRLGLATGVAIVGIGVAAEVHASPLSRARTLEGYALAYDLKFAACYEVLDKAAADDPLDPAPHRAVAAVTWMEILFAQGVATFEAFTGEISKGEVARPAAPTGLLERFRLRIAEARRLAAQQVARLDDADAHYQIGANEALSAIFGGTVEGRLLGSFNQGRRAVAEMERVRLREPTRKEAALILGLSQYTISTMSWPVRTLARVGGLSGNRDTAVALLEEAASPGAETESDALLLLMIIDMREARPADAIRRLQYLQRRHPNDRLLWLNHGAAALEAGRLAEAEQVLSQGIARLSAHATPTVLGETAAWFAQRGGALVSLRRTADALADLQRGLSSDPRDWVRGRIHGHLGDLARLRGDAAGARREYATAIQFSERGGDRSAAKDARQKMSSLER